MSYELYLPMERLERDSMTGRFLYGCVPHNKGKRWEDYMDMRHALRVKKNLELGRIKGNPCIAGWNRRRVIGIRDGKTCVYESSSEAGRMLGIQSRNISHCCNGKRKHAGGIRWFFFDSDDWVYLIKG